MKRNILVLWTVLACVGLVGLVGIMAVVPKPPDSAPEPGILDRGGHRISGPYTHKNLAIYLIHGREAAAGKDYVTLQEAMEKGQVVIHETGDVNELAIENRSGGEVFVQAGDIVKGGQQDRVLAIDLVVPPQSGRIPISSFCVEQGRWRQRGAESTSEFKSADYSLNDKALKLAAKLDKEQGEVWGKVAQNQAKLESSVPGFSLGVDSPSSLQLTLENKELQTAIDEYIAAFRRLIEDKADVVGFAFAINGGVNSADLYASGPLFRKLWTKLLHASAAEAVAERGSPRASDPAPTLSAVRDLVWDAQLGEARIRALPGSKVKESVRESQQAASIESLDADGSMIHRNALKK